MANFLFYSSDMTLRLTALTALTVLLFTGVSCDSHSWEETRVLHGHGQHHGEEHKGDGHAKEAADHDKDAGHGEKPAEGAKKDH